MSWPFSYASYCTNKRKQTQTNANKLLQVVGESEEKSKELKPRTFKREGKKEGASVLTVWKVCCICDDASPFIRSKLSPM